MEPELEHRISLVLPVAVVDESVRYAVEDVRRTTWGMPHEVLLCPMEGSEGIAALRELFREEDQKDDVVLVDCGERATLADAWRAGMARASGDVVVTLGPELTDPIDAVPELVARLRNDELDLVVGSRFARGGGAAATPLARRVLARSAGLLLGGLALAGTSDPSSSLRAYRKSFLDAVHPESVRGGELSLELLVKARERGYRIGQVPIVQEPAPSGRGVGSLAACLPGYLGWAARPLVRPAGLLLATALLTWVSVMLVQRDGRDVPRWDEWANVPHVAGVEPVTLEWLWSAHAEHRFPLARLVYLGLARLFDGDFRAGMFFNVGAMALASVLLIFAARRARGRSSLADLVFPLALCHWGHADNFLWSFQVGFLLTTLFVCALLALFVDVKRAGRKLSAKRTLCVALLLFLLPLVGGAGFLVSAAVTPWLAWVTWSRFRSERGNRRVAWIAVVGLVAVVGVLVAYAIGMVGELTEERAGPGLVPLTLGFLSISAGPVGRALPELGYVVSGLVGATLVGLAVTAFADRGRRLAALGLAFVILGLVGVGIGIALGRAAGTKDVASMPRYVALAAPILCAVHLAFAGRLVRLGSRTVPWLLFLGLALALPKNVLLGARRAADVSSRMRAFELDVWEGLSPRDLARRHVGSVTQTPVDLETLIEMLREARLGPYRLTPAEREPLLRRSYTRRLFREAARPWIPIAVPDEHDAGRLGLFAPAPHELSFPVEAGSYVVRGEFGMRPDSWSPGTSDGVTFRVFTRDPHGGARNRFARLVDPVGVPGDRRVHAFEFAFESEVPVVVVLKTEPGETHVWDWSWWSGIEIEPAGE